MQNANVFINAIAKKILCQLCMLITKHASDENNTLTSNKELASIAECLTYIHQNFNEKLTVAHLADRLHMSRSTFIRQFVRVCSCQPHEYIMQLRIKKAREYLKNSDHSAAYIAQECGFYDVSHMRKYLSSTDIKNDC